MPNLENFLGKSSNKFDGWETVQGNYGCMQCEEDMDHAYFNEDTKILVWVCSQKHESKVELV
jgi:hypothetical protein